MRANLRLLATAAALLAPALACRSKASPPAPPSSSSARPASSPPPPLPTRAPRAEVPRCRVITARAVPGSRDAGSAPVRPAAGTVLDGLDWVDLEPDTEIVLRHALTTRELKLRGPGRFLPCFQGTETVLVATGSVTTTAGAGARAGAEVVLATPLGLLHFADAALELIVSEAKLDVRVQTGIAVLLAAKASPQSAEPLPGEALAGPKGKRRLEGAVDPAALALSCEKDSTAYGLQPAPMASAAPSARRLLGEWSVQNLRARQRARWSCAIARAAAGRLEGPERNRLWDQIRGFDHVWVATPSLGLEAGK